MRKILLLFVLAFLVACTENTAKIEREGQPDVRGFKESDEGMNNAIIKAQATLPQFFEALKDTSGLITDYAVKQRFNTSTGGEHVWLSNIRQDSGKLYGVLANEPYNIKGLKLYDVVEVDEKLISDWFYIKQDTLIGGYTVKEARKRMSEEEKRQFDSELEYVLK